MGTHPSDKTVDRRVFLASTAAGAAVLTAAPTALGNLATGAGIKAGAALGSGWICLLYTSPSPRDKRQSRMPSSA